MQVSQSQGPTYVINGCYKYMEDLRQLNARGQPGGATPPDESFNPTAACCMGKIPPDPRSTQIRTPAGILERVRPYKSCLQVSPLKHALCIRELRELLSVRAGSSPYGTGSRTRKHQGPTHQPVWDDTQDMPVWPTTEVASDRPIGPPGTEYE